MVACGVCWHATGLEERGRNMATEKSKVGKKDAWVESRGNWSREEMGEI